MRNFAEIEYLDIEEVNYTNIIETVVNKCFEVEGLVDKRLYMSITLTNPENIREINKQYRQIDKATDVLSFPMFERDEVKQIQEGNETEKEYDDVLGDIIINLEQVAIQAEEYGHSFERELAYMLVHGFYHLIGYDHMVEDEKAEMRKKEEYVLNLLNITR